MKEDEALIWKRLCSTWAPSSSRTPAIFQSSETNKWRAQSASALPPFCVFRMEEQARASAPTPTLPPPIHPSFLYFRFTERPRGTHHAKISACRLIAQRGGNTIVPKLHIVFTDRQPGTKRAVETNKLITHGREGCTGGLAQVLLSVIVSFLAIKTWAHWRVAPLRLIKDAVLWSIEGTQVDEA